jgi:hypothetical protein
MKKAAKGYIKFIMCRGNGDRVVVRLDSEHELLSDMCTAFEDFMRGCGYQLPNMHVELVSYDEPGESPTLEDKDDELAKLLSEVRDSLQHTGLASHAAVHNKIADYMDKEGMTYAPK